MELAKGSFLWISYGMTTRVKPSAYTNTISVKKNSGENISIVRLLPTEAVIFPNISETNTDTFAE